MSRQTGGKERQRLRRPGHPTLVRLAAWLATIALVKGCGDGDAPTGPPSPDPPRTTTITVSPATADLPAIGATVQLSAQVQDQNGQAMAGVVMVGCPAKALYAMRSATFWDWLAGGRPRNIGLQILYRPASGQGFP